jgi:hypothetical protein
MESQIRKSAAEVGDNPRTKDTKNGEVNVPKPFLSEGV